MLEIKDLKKRFKAKEVLKNLNFSNRLFTGE